MPSPYYSKELNPVEKARETDREMAARREAFVRSKENKNPWAFVTRNNAHGTVVRRRPVGSAVYEGSAGSYCIPVSR